jgi:hypothetical protein
MLRVVERPRYRWRRMMLVIGSIGFVFQIWWLFEQKAYRTTILTASARYQHRGGDNEMKPPKKLSNSITFNGDSQQKVNDGRTHKITVVVPGEWRAGNIDRPPVVHIEVNGIGESPLLEYSNDIYNFEPDVVWFATYKIGGCSKLHQYVLSAKEKRVELGLPATGWPIYIANWRDSPTQRRCRSVEEAVGQEFVLYSQRSIVHGRAWNKTKNWVDEGEARTRSNGVVYKHAPLAVRTDIVETLRMLLHERGITMQEEIEKLERPVDVAHYWPANPIGLEKVGKSHLRTLVSKVVLQMGNEIQGLNVFVGLAGIAKYEGRQNVDSAYVDAMLGTKIVLVTQRDEWEDHFRLFEALVSGALVMTDRMLSLPAGLKNGTSILEFSSVTELRNFIGYYISHEQERFTIAARGRRVAMEQHRSWHRMEEVIFGKAATVCSGDPTSACPYIVHANATS